MQKENTSSLITMAVVPNYVVLISITSALKLMNIAYLFDIFEIKLSV
jgi:hypothetical protein